MSDISQPDISDSNPPLNMQQVPASHTHDIEGNEATDPDPTSPSLNVEEDERVDEVPPSSTTEEVTRTDPAPSPLRKKETDEVTRTDPAPSPLRKKETDEVTRTDLAPSPLRKKETDEATRTDPAPSPLRKKETDEVTRTDPAPSPLKAMEEATRTDLAPSPLPILEPVSKGTDGDPTLDTSSPLGEYEEIQSQLDEMEGEDDSSEGFYKLLREDAEAYLEPTDFCLFEQLPPLWSYVQKEAETLVLEIPLNERNELIKALDKLSRETFGRNAERRPRISGMDKRINELMSLPIKDRLDWKASFLDQYGRRIRFLSIEQRSRTDSEDILQSKLPAWFDPNFDTEIHNYTELTEGAPTYFREFMEQEDSSEQDKLEPVTPWFDADALNNIHTERSAVSTYRSRPNNYTQQHGNSFTKQREFRQWVTGDPSTSLHLPKLPVVAPIISEKSQPIQVCSIDSIPDHVPTVNDPEPVTRQDVAPQEEPTSCQPMESEIGEDIELNGPVVGETAPPQPSVRDSSSDRPMRIEDLQSSRRAIDMSIASSLHRQIDPRSKDIDYKRPRLSADDPINKMSIIAFLLKYQTWDKYGRKIANRSFEAPGQSDWTRAFMIATQLFGEGQAEITQDRIKDLPKHIRDEITRDTTQPLVRIDPAITDKLGPPIHHYDLFRSMMMSTCPTGISSMIDPSLLSRWQSQGLLGVDYTDADVMVFLLKRTQFTSYHEACTALMKPRINWRKIHNRHEADNEFGRYVEDFGDVLRMTTYMTDLTIPDLIRGSSGLITISPALIAEYFLMGLDNFAISSELLPVWTRESLWDSPNKTTLLDLISTTRRHFLAWCYTAGNKPTMDVLRNRANEEDIPLGLTAMRTYSRGVTPSAQAPTKRARRSGGKSRGTPQHKYIPEKHEREGSKFCTFCSNVEGNNPVGHTVFECKDPRCARSRVPKEERFRLGEQEAPASRGSVERGRGGRGRRVHRFKFRGRGGRYRGHKGRGQYRPIHNINTTEDISSNASPTESKPTRSSTVPHRRINNSNRNSRTGNFPNRVHINAINHNQSTTDLGNPVNNFPTAQQNLLIPLQIHQTSSDINSIFDINSTVSENHVRSQRSPFLRLEISINDIKMIATIDSAAFCSVITADLAEQCHMSINSKDTIKFLPANNVSTKSLGSATGILSFNVGSIAQQVHYKHTLPIIPGSNKLLIGTDMLKALGLQTDDGLFIRLDKEHRTLLNAESEFDSRIAQHSIGNLDNQSPSPSDFEEQLARSGCEINLDDSNNKLKLTSLLKLFSDVFSETPNRKGIDCNPLTIPFRDENAIVHKPARRLNPSKMEIANKIFDELIEMGYAVESNYKFSSPIVLVIYPDGKKTQVNWRL
ncbi:hypothetical protein P9112_011334 [Eukaryota sp. TZLM1-RC]